MRPIPVEADLCMTLQISVRKPVDHAQGAFDATDLAQVSGKLVQGELTALTLTQLCAPQQFATARWDANTCAPDRRSDAESRR